MMEIELQPKIIAIDDRVRELHFLPNKLFGRYTFDFFKHPSKVRLVGETKLMSHLGDRFCFESMCGLFDPPFQ